MYIILTVIRLTSCQEQQDDGCSRDACCKSLLLYLQMHSASLIAQL